MRPMSTDDRLDGCPDDPEFEARLREIAAEIEAERHTTDKQAEILAQLREGLPSE